MRSVRTLLVLALSATGAFAPAVAAAGAAAGPVQVLEEGPDGVTLRFTSPGVLAGDVPGQPGRVELRGPGLERLQVPGKPVLPFGRAVIGVPEGHRPVLHSIRADARAVREATPAVFMPAWFGVEPELLNLAVLPPLPRGAFPEHPAEIAWVGWMRDMQVAEVRFFPYRSAGASDGLLHHSEILVRVEFEPDPGARPLRRGPVPDGPAGRWGWYRKLQSRAVVNGAALVPGKGLDDPDDLLSESTGTIQGFPSAAMAGPAVEPLKLFVEEDGLYGIAPSDLSAAGVNPATVNPQDFRLELEGIPLQVEVTGEGDGSFDPNDRLIFHGLAATGKLTRRNVYWLHFDGSPSRVTSRDGTFGAAAPTPTSFETTRHEEMNLIYTQLVPGGAIDHWWWVRQITGDPATEDVTYNVDLVNVDPSPHTISLRVNLQGRTGVTHHTRVYLNGPLADDQTWAGVIPFDHNVSLASSSVFSGTNAVRVVVVGDLSSFDQAYSNFIEVTYRRTYDAVSDALVAAGEGPGDFRFSFNGFGSAAIHLYDVTDPNGMEKISVPSGQITGTGPFDIAFQDSLASDRLYAAATKAGLKTPAGIVQEVSSNLAADPNGADWIVITPPDPNWVSALQPLVSHRQGQGYRVLVATTEDIYDEFNSGVFDPAAIEAFLDNAWATYPGAPPEFVLLAGDAHVDYLDNFGSGIPQFVPAKLVDITGFGEMPSDNEYAMTAGGDFLPELVVGRLPAQSASELSAMVSKIVGYETSPPVSTLNARSLFIADDDDSAFEAILDSFASLMPPHMAQQQIYMATLGVGFTRIGIRDGFDGGALMATYLGHGGATHWAAECPWASGVVSPCFTDDPATLASTGNLTFVAALNCINGYFVDLAAAGPGHVDYSLAEAMIRQPNRGAIAMWAPAALATVSDYSSIGDWLFRNIFLDREYVLGRAAVTAVVSAVTQPFSPANMRNVRELTFFGDPATILALDSDNDGLVDRDEELAGYDPLDGDTDDDGLSDGVEAAGSADPDLDGLANALDPDSDNDGILDGTEAGIISPPPGTNTGAGFFVPDADPNTVTDPFDADTDGGGASDGAEDRNFDGSLDSGETDPTAGNAGDDLTCASALPEIMMLDATTSGSDVVLSWDDILGSHPCALYRLYAAPNAGFPKPSFTPFGLLRLTSSPGFVHAGAATDGVDYDYLVVAFDPLTGEGPLGHYGQ